MPDLGLSVIKHQMVVTGNGLEQGLGVPQHLCECEKRSIIMYIN